jgi:hypothetical protein
MKDGHPYYPSSESVLTRAGVQRLSDSIRERQRRAGVRLRTSGISPQVASWMTARAPHACRGGHTLLADVLQQRMTTTRARQARTPRDTGLAEVRLAEDTHTVECPVVSDTVAPTGFGGT